VLQRAATEVAGGGVGDELQIHLIGFFLICGYVNDALEMYNPYTYTNIKIKPSFPAIFIQKCYRSSGTPLCSAAVRQLQYRWTG